ncbi:MAG: hypothetical protein RCG16_00485 [Rickettsia hoogstraalii]
MPCGNDNKKHNSKKIQIMKILKLFIFILLISKNFYALSIGANEQQATLECEGTADKKL